MISPLHLRRERRSSGVMTALGLQIARLQLVSGPACGGALMIAGVSDAVTDPETSATVPACTNTVLDPPN